VISPLDAAANDCHAAKVIPFKTQQPIRRVS
jgi:hypothetical protein